MSNTVFANKLEVICKESGGKSIAAFPDVCFTPPTAPPTPPGVPIPYPNTSFASDSDAGTKAVKIAGKTIIMKDQSHFKKSVGDEAGSAPKKNVITSTNRGKSFFNSWSMDVKFQGENVTRNTDLTTHNHASQTGATPPIPHFAKASMANPTDEQCRLRPYKPKECPEGQTGHHCVPDHCFRQPNGAYFAKSVPNDEGLCVCVPGKFKDSLKDGTRAGQGKLSDKDHYTQLAKHGRIHKLFDMMEKALGAKGTPPKTASLGSMESAAAKVIAHVTGCDEEDLKKQMRAHHKKKGLPANTRVRADPGGHGGNVAIPTMPGGAG